MGQPYVGEIRLFGGNFAPSGWFFCNGQELAISEYSTLFNLIGTTYGGDGITVFALPDLQGRVPVHQGSGYVMGELGGAENVTILASTLPGHTHSLPVSGGSASTSAPGGNAPAPWSGDQYAATAPTSTLGVQSVTAVGSDLPHENMPPFLTLSFIISAFGVYPSQS